MLRSISPLTRRRALVAAALLAPLLAPTGCATPLYPGPARPRAELAVLSLGDLALRSVDGHAVRDKVSKIEVLPGPHRLGLSLEKRTPEIGVIVHEWTNYIKLLCVTLEADHSYRTKVEVRSRDFFPRIVDVRSGRAMHGSCRDNDDALPADRPATDSPPQAGATAPAAPPVPQVAATAEDQEDAGSWTDSLSEGPGVGTGLSLSAGYGWGGAEIARGSGGERLTAGKGLVASIGGKVTPLWLTDEVGLGVGLDVGVRYDSLSSSSGVERSGYPVDLTVHLFAGERPHFFFAAIGATKELGVSYKGVEVMEASSTVGVLGKVGYWFAVGQSYAFSAQLFAASPSDLLDGKRVSAHRFGLSLGAHWEL